MVDAVLHPCAHCGADLAGNASADDIGDAPCFCCAGCRCAHDLIHAAGLADFYRQLPTGTALPPRSHGSESWDDLVRSRRDGLAEITWHVTGMHCAACVWLLERMPVLCPGVRAATARFGDDALRVVFAPGETGPTAIAAVITRLGYGLHAPSAKAAAARQGRRDLLARFAVSAASAMAAMHLSLNLYAGDLTRDLDHGSRLGIACAAALVTAPALLYGAMPFWRSALAGLRAGHIGIDAVTAAVLAVGTLASVIGIVTGGDLYFDAVAMYIAILLAGRLALQVAKEHVLRASGLEVSLLPRQARRIVASGVEDVPACELRVGDRIVVDRGGICPCDGTVTAAVEVDAAVLSGEARPQAIPHGGTALAGTTCLSESLEMVATAVGGDTCIGRLLAEVGKPRPAAVLVEERWIARSALLVLIAALAVFAWWWPHDHGFALRQAVAVVMVCCPCAFGLAVPLAQAAAIAQAAARGILLTDPRALANLARVRVAVFDKTGTLTTGRMQVADWRWSTAAGEHRAGIVAAVVAAEARAHHPAAVAIALQADVAPADISDWREFPGGGVSCRARIGGAIAELRIGSAAFTGCPPAPIAPDADDHAVVHVAVDGKPIACIRLADPVRSDAAAMIAVAKAQGWDTWLLSGDGVTATSAVAGALGIAHHAGGLLPADKAARIADLGPCLLIGDGANDAPAMRRAVVAIGVRGGLAAALDGCDAVFIGDADRDRAQAMAALIAAARAGERMRWRLLAFASAYNVLGITLVALGWWGPWICAIAMPASSLFVIAMATWRKPFTSAPIAGTPSIPSGREVSAWPTTAHAGIPEPR